MKKTAKRKTVGQHIAEKMVWHKQDVKGNFVVNIPGAFGEFYRCNCMTYRDPKPDPKEHIARQRRILAAYIDRTIERMGRK